MRNESSARTPNVARIYDYLLGGKDNYEEDRQAAAQLLEAVPDAAVAAWDNRQFLGRVVQFLMKDAGIRQIIDIGTGLPTRGNVHAIAHQIAADSRVAYVDNDSLVIAHSNALLNNHPNVVVVDGDLRDPDNITANAELRALIDFDKPLAFLLVAVLHFITDSENPSRVVSRLKAAMPPGSYLVISHVTDDQVSLETTRRVQKLYEDASAPGVARSRRDIAAFFNGLEMIPPGVVSVAQWRPEWHVTEPGRTIFYGGVGVKRGAKQCDL
jgi:O-methyltransferase involved in polyketide biosynthesis